MAVASDISPVPSLSKEHYILKLTLDEFAILNSAEMDGLLKYGGTGDFKLSMAKEGDSVSWIITIDNPRLMELLGIFVGEKTIQLVQSLDVNNISPSQKVALGAIKTLSMKLDEAKKNPIWDPVKLSGVVEKKENGWVLETDDETLKLTGSNVTDLQKESGKSFLAEGIVKTAGEFEVTRFIEKRKNTLELFVMSFCPFGQAAESKLLKFLATTKIDPKPALEVHYIFYKQSKDGKDVFASMHGEEEVLEDLVQMIVRDRYPQLFQAYLQLRSENDKTPWKQLVEQIGLGTAETDQIQQIITTERDQMIRKEYEYADGRYGIDDGSPSYVWESERVPNLKRIEAFKGLEAINGQGCSN